jgi:hypothetical protein
MNHPVLPLAGSTLNREITGESKLRIFNILRCLFLVDRWNTAKAAIIPLLVGGLAVWISDGRVLKLYFW